MVLLNLHTVLSKSMILSGLLFKIMYCTCQSSRLVFFLFCFVFNLFLRWYLKSNVSHTHKRPVTFMDSALNTPLLLQLWWWLIKGEMGRYRIPPFPRSWEEPAPGGKEKNNGRKLGEELGSSCWQDDPEDESDGTPRTSGHWPAALSRRNCAL